MAVSRSYPRHFFPFCEKKKRKKHSASYFLLFHLFLFKKTTGYRGQVTTGYHGLFYLFKHGSTQLGLTQLDSTRLNSAQLGSTRLNSAQLGSTPLNSAQICSLRSTFKKDLFASIAFTFFKKMQLYHLIILLLVILLPVICPVIWCFPIWLTSSLSYPMAIFSANEIRTFISYFIC